MLNEQQLNGMRYGETYTLVSNPEGSYVEISKTYRRTAQRDFFDDSPEDSSEPEEVVKKGKLPVNVTFFNDVKQGKAKNFQMPIQTGSLWSTVINNLVIGDEISFSFTLNGLGSLPKNYTSIECTLQLNHRRPPDVKRFVQTPPRTFMFIAKVLPPKEAEEVLGEIEWIEPGDVETEAAD